MTENNTEEIKRLLEEAFAERARAGTSRLTMDSPYLGEAEYKIGLANAFSALAEATQKMAEDFEELNKKFGDLAERLGE